MMTPQQALTLMTNLEAAVKRGEVKPDQIVKACNRLARESISWAINAQRRDTMLLDGINEVRAAAGLPPIGRRQTATAPAQAAPAQAASGAPRGPNGYRLNPDGSEMDADQSAREDMMDSAIDGAVQAGEVQPGHTAFTPPAPSSEVTHDGTPVTIQVDAAPVPAPAPAAPAPSVRDAAMDRAIAAQAAARVNGPAQKA